MHGVNRVTVASIAFGLFALGLFIPQARHYLNLGPVSPAHAASKAKQRTTIPQAAWYARRLPSAVVLAGLSAADDDFDDRVSALFKGLEVESWIDRSNAAGSDFARAQMAALKALATLASGFVEIRGQRVTVDAVSSGSDVEALRRQLAAELPPGYAIARLAVVPPEAAPYAFSAYHDGGEVIELSGFVPSDAARRTLVATAVSFGEKFRVVDRLETREGAPPGFEEAARAALLQLRQFESGVVSLTGHRLDLVGLIPGAEWTEQAVCRLTIAVLPSGYSCGFIYFEGPPIRIMGGGGMGGKGGGRVWHYRSRGKSLPKTEFRPVDAKVVPTSPLKAMDDDPRLVDLYFATNREVKENDKPTQATLSAEDFTGERADRLRFGVVRVHIPDDHKIGQIKLPGAISLFGWTIRQEEIDPKKHFFIRSRQLLSREQWESYVRALKKTDALIFVHGFNNTFDEAAFRMAQIVWDLGYRGLPVLFSWPSRGGTLNYFYDRDSALGARRHFIDLLQILQNNHGIERIHVLAHSMGNFIVVDALANNARTTDPVRIAELIMAAPDVDVDQFKEEIPLVQKVAKGMTLYASSNDKALVISRSVAGGIPRAGDVPAGGPITLAGLDTIDVSTMGEEMFGLNHDTFASARSLIDDIFILLGKGDRPPRLRQIRPMPEGAAKPAFWRYAP